MKKKLLAVLISVCTVASLAGCSGGKLSDDYITINKYKGLEVAKVETTEVTDDDVETQISSNLTTASVTTPVTDRASQEGDTVNITATTDFENGNLTDRDVEIGSGTLIPANGDYKGFEDQLIGHKAGDTFEVEAKFGDDYSQADLAGQVKKWSVTMNSVSLVTVPELTDDWVKENSDTSKTVEDYKKEVKKSLEDSAAASADSDLQSAVMTALLADDNVTVSKYPDGAVDDTVKEMTTYYENMATQYGMEFTDFLSQYFNMTEDDFTKQVQTASESTVKQDLACELIAKKKNLTPSDAEYKKEYAKYAEDFNYEDADAIVEQVGEEQLKKVILQQKVAEYLAENCVQVEAADTSTTNSTTDTSTTGTSTTDTSTTDDSSK